MYFLFLNLGGGEIMVIALFVLMFFGSKQIPELMRGLGRATREFKDAMNGIEREVRSAVNVNTNEEVKKPFPAPPPGVQQTAASKAATSPTEDETKDNSSDLTQ